MKVSVLARVLGLTLTLVLASALLSVGFSMRSTRTPAPVKPVVDDVLFPRPDGKQSVADQSMTDVIFLHHSVGQNLIEEGGLRGLLASRGYRLYDQGYNVDGLHLPDGSLASYGLNVPDDNTDPDGLANIFTQPVDVASLTSQGAPANTLSGLLRHDVIMFKSCFPTTLITSDDQLAQYRAYYVQIRAVADRYPDHVFIAVTSPPLEPTSTNAAAATRARAWANWLTSPEYLSGHPNLFVFDLFSLLAEPDQTRWDANTLQQSYRQQRGGFRFNVGRMALPVADQIGLGRRLNAFVTTDDSHPNLMANQAIAPALADAVVAATHTPRGN